MEKISKKLLSNTAILGAGTFVSKVLVFLLMPFYTAWLSTDQFGVADILSQTANLIIPLAVLGISDGLFRFALDGDKEARANTFSCAVFVFVCGLIPIAALIQLLRIFSIYDGYVWLVFFYVCTANLHLICANYIRACDKPKTFALQGIINTALTIALNVIFLAVFKMGVLGYVLSVAVSDLLVTLGLIVFCKLYKEIKFKKPNKKLLRSMLRFSIPYIPTTMMWMITSASDRFILTAFSGASENGLYAAAYKLPTLISLAGGVFIEAWQFSVVSDSSKEERVSFFESVYKNYVGIMFMGTSLLVLASKPLTSLLLNASYYESWKFVPVLSIAMIFSAFSAFMGSVYFLEKRSLRSLITATSGAFVNIVLNVLLIPTQGAMGAAIATVVSYVIVYVIRAYDTGKYLKFNLCITRVLINTLMITVQTVIMILEVPNWIYWQIGIVIFMLFFNGGQIIKGILRILKKNKKTF